MIPTTESQVRKAKEIIIATLRARGFEPRIRDWLLASRGESRFLFAVFDDQAMSLTTPLSRLAAPDLLHDLSAQTRVPVIVSNSKGFRYAVVLQKPTLPPLVVFPNALPLNALPFGMGYRGQIAALPAQIINILVAGGQGSGKSNFIKAITYAASRHGWDIYLADAEGHTFNPDAHSAIAKVPVAQTVEELKGLNERIEAELQHRAELYRQAARDGLMPDSLDSYNREAQARLLPALNYMLFVVDEANTFFAKGMEEALTDLARRGRKWGLLMVLAAHSWRSKDVSRTLSMLFPTRVCFRVSDDTSGKTVIGDKLGKRAMSLRVEQRGRGYLRLDAQYHALQAFHFDEGRERAWLRAALKGETPQPLLNESEKKLLAAIRQEPKGRVTTEMVEATLAISNRQARKLLDEWKTRGWLYQPGHDGNAHFVTERAPRI